MANEILPLVGNTGTGWQVVDPDAPGGVAGFVANEVGAGFVDIAPVVPGLTAQRARRSRARRSSPPAPP